MPLFCNWNRPVCARVAAALSGLLMALWSVALHVRVLDNVPHGYDEIAYYFQAQIFASGKLTATGTPFRDSFWNGNVVTHEDKRFGKYPPGWPAILAAFMAAGHPELANAAMAGICAILIWLVADRLFGRTEAWISMVLVLISPFHAFLGASYLSHMSCAASLMLYFFSALRGLHAGSRAAETGWACAAGAGVGFALLTRPFTATLGVAGITMAVSLADGFRWRNCLRMALAASSVAAVFCWLFLFYNRATTGSPWIMGHKYYMPDFSFLGEEGFHRQGLWENVTANIPRMLLGLNHQIWGWPVSDLWPLAIGLVILRWERRYVGLLAAALLYCGLHSFYYYFDNYYGPRLLFEALPWIIIATASSLTALWRRAGQASRPRPAKAVVILAFTGCLVSSVFRFYPSRIAYYSQDYCGQGGDLVRAVRQRNLKDAIVFLRTPDGFHYSNLSFMNNADLRKSPVLFARFVPKDLGPVMSAFPRKEAWILDASYSGMLGPDGYPDRFRLQRVHWTRIR